MNPLKKAVSSTNMNMPSTEATLASSSTNVSKRFSNASASSVGSASSTPSVTVKKQRVYGSSSNNSRVTKKGSSNDPPKPQRLSNASVSSVGSSISTSSVAVKKQRVYGNSSNNSVATKKSSLSEKTSNKPLASVSTPSSLAFRNNKSNGPTSNNARASSPAPSASSNPLNMKKRSINASDSSETAVKVPQKRQADGTASIASRAIRQPISRRKTPADWNTKGRLQNTLEKNAEITKQVREVEEEKVVAQTEIDIIHAELQEVEQECNELEAVVNEEELKYNQEVERMLHELNAENKVTEDEIESTQSKISAIQKETEEVEQLVQRLKEKVESERAENVILNERKNAVEKSSVDAKALLSNEQMSKKNKEDEWEQTEAQIAGLVREIKEEEKMKKEMKKKLFEEEIQRRKDHELLQELKGNIRVFCRVRPSSNPNTDKLAEIRYFGDKQEGIEVLEQTVSARGKTSKKPHQYTFDKVFPPKSTQEECYEEISQLVQSALDGHNVCIFAYGQTGSGKTYTMQGPHRSEKNTWGMIPRAIQQIYDVAQKLKEYDWEYEMEGEFLEIYNDSINDLLADPSTYRSKKHEIRHTDNGTVVTNLNSVVLDSRKKVELMLKKAMQNRATGATNLNERSSRSHSVFILRLNGYNKKTEQHTSGRLNLIDLAGSERLRLSGSTGERLKESIHINKSLSCLKNVIHALVENEKGAHIRYRDSKLTYLLKNSLGRKCKTLMFLNISPLETHLNESISSLRFAKEANAVVRNQE